jgi:hypothetical protein
VAVVDPALDLLDDEARLVLLVEPGVQLHRFAAFAGAPEFLAEAAAVVRDHTVGGAQDGLGRAVVLFQAHHARVREILAEALDVLDLGAAPAVDRLVVVAHGYDRNHVPASTRSQAYWMVLVSWNSSTRICRKRPW